MPLRYEVVSSRDNVLWSPLSSWCSKLVDAVSAALDEVLLRERTSVLDWIGVFDHDKRAVVWKIGPDSSRKV